MLKTNSKKFKDKVRLYIIDGYNDWLLDNPDYFDVKCRTFDEVANAIFYVFLSEKMNFNVKSYKDFDYFVNKRYGSLFNMFNDWCQGLPSILDCDYYYNVCAVDLLGDWLEQSIEDRGKYSESDSEKRITEILYRELYNVVYKNIDSLVKHLISRYNNKVVESNYEYESKQGHKILEIWKSLVDDTAYFVIVKRDRDFSWGAFYNIEKGYWSYGHYNYDSIESARSHMLKMYKDYKLHLIRD